MQTRTKLIWCMVWVLGVMLIAASLDASPDPPAVDPHGAMIKALNLRDCAGCLQNQPSLAAMPYRAQTQRIAFTHEDEPDGPGDFIARTGQAADSSPPAGSPVLVD
jgi:hypothetical protein